MPIIFSSSFDTEIKLFILDQVREYPEPGDSRYLRITDPGPDVSCPIAADIYSCKTSEQRRGNRQVWED